MDKVMLWVTEPSHFFAFVFFVFGCVMGSFLNVCIYRMPLGKSLLHPPSSCPHCGYRIPWFQNIPILTWILQRGKCAHCSNPIRARYLYVELLTGITFAAVWLIAYCQLPNSNIATQILVGVALSLLMAGLIVATAIDFEHFIIPDEITIGGVAAGLFLSASIPELHSLFLKSGASRWQAVSHSLLGAAVGGGIVYAVVLLGKLMFGRLTFEFDAPTSVTFSETELLLPDRAILYEDVFYRRSDIVRLHADKVELIDRCFIDVDVALSSDQLKIGVDTFSTAETPHMEVVTRKIVVPREAMGFGDVKFMAAIGSFLGWQATVFSLMASAMVGSIVGICLMLLRRTDISGRLPYGPYIALATVIWIFGGHALWRYWWEMSPLLR